MINDMAHQPPDITPLILFGLVFAFWSYEQIKRRKK